MPTVVLVGVATPEIAHAHIATLLEFVEIGDEGVGLHDIGQVAAAAFNRDLGITWARRHQIVSGLANTA